MARGFGATLGAGTTDAIVSALTAHATLRSYSIWTNRNGEGGGSLGRIFDKRTGADAQVELFRNNGDGTYFFDRSWTSNGSWLWTAPSASVWTHHLIAYDQSSTADPIVYQNGSPVSITVSTPPSGSAITNTSPYVIGNRTNDSARNWDGILAEFAAWDRILTAGEALALAKGFSPLFFPVGLVEYVPMIRDNGSRKNAAPTITGTAVQPHPPMIYPAMRQKGKVARIMRNLRPWQFKGGFAGIMAQ